MSWKTGSGRLLLEDGSTFEGETFGFSGSAAGEVVFNTGMVGYPEAFTDPSYKGQILTLTYPLIGNYGVASSPPGEQEDLQGPFESNAIQITGLIVSEFSLNHSHWSAKRGLAEWLCQQKIPALSGIDTRALTKRLREKGSLLGKILVGEEACQAYDPNQDNVVSQVSITRPRLYQKGKKRVVVVDCGCKNGIVCSLVDRDITVIRVPWDYDFLKEDFQGVVISNGPGDPQMCGPTIENVRKALDKGYPTLGICLGNQILALAAGATTYKLKFGHRSQNQPCYEVGTRRCFITSQNHGFAVDSESLPDGWEAWFLNSNDGSNEGIRHRTRPFFSVQFHPEAKPGPVDTNYLFDDFSELL